MSSISLVTVNIEYGNRNRKKIKERSDLIIQNSPDIIFVQECNKKAINFKDNYDYIDYTIVNKEVVDVYLRKDSEWKKEYITQFDTKYSYTLRTCKIIHLKNTNTNKIIKLANVHLCGGRFDENDKVGGMLLGSVKEIHQRKNEVLDKLVNEYNIDIIAGDFNSDLICYLQNDLQPQHLSYFKKISPNTSIINFKEWNIAPYNYLESKNYNLALALNLNKSDISISQTNKPNTSIFNTHPDSIWFKNGTQIEYKYIDLISNNLSDHNGIYCNVMLS